MKGGWPAALPEGQLNPELAKAAALIQRRLAFDGLLPTLARVIEMLGLAHIQEHPVAAQHRLRAVGFPVDWLEFFHPTPYDPKANIDWVAAVAERLQRGGSVVELEAELRRAFFQFKSSHPTFEVIREDGEQAIGAFRLQIAGGYQEGIIPGGILDFCGRLVEAMPDADLLANVASEFLEPVRWLAGHCWDLRRRNHLTLISAPSKLSSWAQDHGKPGLVRRDPNGTNRWAVLLPRYASWGEGVSLFLPADSFLAGGLQQAGLQTVPSPLLFQGGNLLAIRDPVTDRRLLVIGEGEIFRNTALGLTPAQVLEAFRVEFGVDEGLVLPTVSYHVDFDVTFRVHKGRLKVFVNDPVRASRIILGLGINALEGQRLLSVAAAQTARKYLQTGEHAMAVATVSDSLEVLRNADGTFPAWLARCFTNTLGESPSRNLQCFLVALDVLLSANPAVVERFAGTEKGRYLSALRRTLQGLQRQHGVLQKRGWDIIPVPSLPDLNRGPNYLNGVQNHTSYLMPAWGGFYAELDRAAGAAFKEALGASIAIVPLPCSDSQSHHGGVHCLVSPFPKLDAPPGPARPTPSSGRTP